MVIHSCDEGGRETGFSEVNMQEDNIIKATLLTDIVEFTIQKKEVMTQEELNIIHSYGFFLTEYFTRNNYMYYTFRRGYHG